MKRILLAGAAVLALSVAAAPAALGAGRSGAYEPAAPQPPPFAAGAWVEEVIADSPAARAGIRAGDVIVAIDGVEIVDYADLDAAMAASGGRPLAIDVERGGTRLRLRATPILAFVQPLYGDVRRRWALGVSHTEYRMVPCREEPDCE
jgi:S1-C subfamily serine protease